MTSTELASIIAMMESAPPAAASTTACPDHRCADGVTMRRGCNGFGKVTAAGKRYKLRSGARNIGATAVEHEQCAGTGMAACGCTELDSLTLATITGAALAARTGSPVTLLRRTVGGRNANPREKFA